MRPKKETYRFYMKWNVIYKEQTVTSIIPRLTDNERATACPHQALKSTDHEPAGVLGCSGRTKLTDWLTVGCGLPSVIAGR